MGIPHLLSIGLADRRFADHHGRCPCRHTSVLRTLPLMHELTRRARALGFSWPELAKEIGLDRTTLAHIRSGKSRISLGTLHRIALWFPNDEAIQRLVWDYLLLDVETRGERTEKERTRSSGAGAHERTLTEPSVTLLRSFVAELPDHAVRGTGLLLASTDTAALSAALGFLEGELRARRVHVLRHPASAKVAAAAIPALVAAPVLLVDRVEHASPSMASVLRGRAAYLKVTVATSAGGGGSADSADSAAHEPSLLSLLTPRLSRAVIEAALPAHA